MHHALHIIKAQNKVLGKVMFSEVCVSHSVHGSGVGGLCMMLLSVWLPGPIFLLGAVSVPGPRFLPGGLCLGGFYRPPPESEKQAVRILLEWFLVYI